MDTPESLANSCAGYGQAAGWLFDSYTTAYGGSGQTFDYGLLAGLSTLGDAARPVIISGGLKVTTVGQAIQTVSPWAVDVSSGVEDAAGIKSATKMRDFVAAVTVHGAAPFDSKV